MAYIGKQPVVGNFQVCDAISVVNGQAAYTMQVASANVEPENANHMLVSLNGILQKPGSSFTISGATITFASNLVTNDVIDFIILLGDTLNVGTPSDNTVSLAKLTATGTKSSSTFLRGDNTFAEAGGGAYNLINTAVASSASSLTITGLDSTYDTYAIAISSLTFSGNSGVSFRLGDSSGVDSGSSDYSYHVTALDESSASYAAVVEASGAAQIPLMANQLSQSTSGMGFGAMLFLTQPADSTVDAMVIGNTSYITDADDVCGGVVVARRKTAIATDRVFIAPTTGTFSGRMTVWGIAHA